MENYVYVLTREDGHVSTVLGVYTDPMLAMNAIWTLNYGSIVGPIKEETVGTRYTVLNYDGEEEYYYIEKVTLNEKLW